MNSRIHGGRQKATHSEKSIDTSDDDGKVTDNQGDCNLVVSLDMTYK
jgi:hypothetical protein